MPELQSSEPASSAAMPPMLEAAAPRFEDADYALGCECANPALQIERWLQEAGDAGDQAS